MSDDGYVHDPSDFTEEEDENESDGQATAGMGAHPDTVDREFGLRGWILVGWLFVALVVVPAYLFFYPTSGEALSLFGLGYRDTYLFVPLLPAIILGALAVWATMRP